MSAIEVRVPDIGDFKDVPVIDVLVKPGDTVGIDDSLITLESDKATMDVPAPSAGTVKELRVRTGDQARRRHGQRVAAGRAADTCAAR
jgi:pyruvate/2-oxoglutarate dehydrogenase complex dihydrolipoamide acyltransferase (E2) component